MRKIFLLLSFSMISLYAQGQAQNSIYFGPALVDNFSSVLSYSGNTGWAYAGNTIEGQIYLEFNN